MEVSDRMVIAAMRIAMANNHDINWKLCREMIEAASYANCEKAPVAYAGLGALGSQIVPEYARGRDKVGGNTCTSADVRRTT